MKPFLLVSTRPEEEAIASEYQAYLRASRLDPEQLELAEFDLIGLPPVEPSQYSGVFVAGSPYGGGASTGYLSQTQQWIRDELRDLFQQLLTEQTPLLATGNAVSILGEVLGLPTSDQYSEFGELAEIELTREGQEDPIFQGLPDAFLAYVNHADSVEETSGETVRLARSLNAPVQVFRHGELTYAVQFIPELDAELIDAKVRAFEDAGDTGIGDIESLVTTGRHGSGRHAAAGVLANFVRIFGAES